MMRCVKLKLTHDHISCDHNDILNQYNNIFSTNIYLCRFIIIFLMLDFIPTECNTNERKLLNKTVFLITHPHPSPTPHLHQKPHSHAKLTSTPMPPFTRIPLRSTMTDMKKTLDHLPERKQQDIDTIATILRDARYSEHYEITVEELDYLAEEVEKLKVLTEEVCRGRIGENIE